MQRLLYSYQAYNTTQFCYIRLLSWSLIVQSANTLSAQWADISDRSASAPAEYRTTWGRSVSISS